MKWTKFRLLATSSFVLFNAVCTSFASETFPALSDEKTVGVQVKIQNFTASDADQIKTAGFAFVRLDVWSNSLGSTAYQTQLKNAFANAGSANLPVLMTVRSLKALTNNTADGSHDLAIAGEAFAQSIIDLEKTYHSQLLAIEIWNEPDLSTYWPTGNFETTFVPFMSTVCNSLKQRVVSTPVIGFGFAKAPTKDSKSTIALTGILTDYPKCLNAISYHPYGMSTTEISRTQTFIQDTFKLPGVASEWGVPSVSGTGGTTGQATKIANFIAEIKRLNMPLFSIYEWKNNDSGSNDGERNFGLITSEGKPKPAAIAVQAILNPQ